ncbi:MAG: hypothetical protein Q9181_007892, partial [Wetmoreana brouardii]
GVEASTWILDLEMTFQLAGTHRHKENTFATVEHSDISNLDTPAITRSASSIQLGSPSAPDLRRTYSAHALPDSYQNLEDGNQNSESATGAEMKERQNCQSIPRPKVAVSQFTLGPPVETVDGELELQEARMNGKRRSMSRSLSRLARRSWISSPRSPSPPPSASKRQDTPHEAISGRKSLHTSRSLPSSTSDTENTSKGPKNQRRPLSTMVGKVSPVATVPSVPPVPKSLSTDKLPLVHNPTFEIAPIVPNQISSERLQDSGTEVSRKKDELSSAFRALDADFQKHVLLPGGRSLEHPSNTALRPENLDRRVNILNRWWTGLLEMLSGRNGESVSGSDRPTVLEAVTFIMTRAEWSIPYHRGNIPSSQKNMSISKTRSTTSLASASSNFLTDSVLYNVKNTYVQNLLSQMAYVVEKMSSRNVPASLVTFCGKATAYAFFFCDGVAEILVRLWALPQETIRRVLTENQVQKDADLKSWSECVVPAFPSVLHGLAFKSLRATMRYLRSRPQLPIATSYIPWHGPWVGRWAGRDTDLFFVFTKFYHNLMSSFLSSNPSLHERICAPGYVLLQGQILAVLDAIIQRSNGQSSLDLSYVPTQYDEMLRGPNASASILPLPPAANRSMAENRLILLLRDCLSGSTSVAEKVRRSFAESFEGILKAAARRTSIFDHSACFTLCDFMEEAITILVRYNTSTDSGSSALDWPFWLEVCRQMMESQNTMTEIRLYAFLYSQWGLIIADENRKRQITLGWLLEKDCFQNQFNHWCPMVRAYCMRLLCWRVGRLNDPSSMLDSIILEALSIRLNQTWSAFLHSQNHVLGKGGPRLSTAPCSPAPGREFSIIRNDSQPTQGSMFLTFDSILSSTSSTQATTYQSHDLFSASPSGKGALHSSNPSRIGKSWTLLRNMIPFATSPTYTLKGNTGQNTAKSRDRMQSQSKGQTPSTSSDEQENTAFQSHSFKFSLEWIGNEKHPFGRERQLCRPQLPLYRTRALQRSDFDEEGLELHERTGVTASLAKYSGRALAEWDLLLEEYQNFIEKRRAEGIPSDSLVETPTLGVETFR